MRIIETKVYTYEELSPEAQEKARDRYRKGRDDNDFADCVIDNACQAAEMLGIEITTKPVRLYGGGTREKPVIYWSGFSSQGDGACYQGILRTEKADTNLLRREWPEDKTLHAMADAVDALKKEFDDVVCYVDDCGGRYSHSNTMRFGQCFGTKEGFTEDEGGLREDEAAKIVRMMKDFADWIYRSLEKEWDYQNSDEVVAENIIANEYEFTEEGERM